MKILILICCLLSFQSMAQLDGEMMPNSGSNLYCLTQENCVGFLFQGRGGSGYYKYVFKIGNKLDSIRTVERYFNCHNAPIIDSAGGLTVKYYDYMDVLKFQDSTQYGIKLKLISITDEKTDSTMILNDSTITYPDNNQFNFPVNNVVACAGEMTTISVPTFMFQGTLMWEIQGDKSIPDRISFIATETRDVNVSFMNQGGCMYSGRAHVEVKPTPNMPKVEIDSAQCNDGRITIIDTNSIDTYHWKSINTSKLENVRAGDYTLVAQNNQGCSAEFKFTIPQKSGKSDCSIIRGKVLLDVNKNCKEDLEDRPVSNRMIIANPGEYISFSNSKGEYSFALPNGQYTLTEKLSNVYTSSCEKSLEVTIDSNSNIVENANFYDTLISKNDASTEITVNNVRPGFSFVTYPIFKNSIGSKVLENEKTWMLLPDSIFYVSCNYPVTKSNDTLFFSLDSTVNVKSLVVNLVASRNIKLGTELTFCTGIEWLQDEENTSNNVACKTITVIGSFDPNDKKLFVNGKEKINDILITDSILDYQIRFQNTGTADAVNIYVLDTISENLDLTSFNLVSTSHKCEVEYLGDRVYKFSFPEIHLLDSTTNEALSHGYIHYSIKQSDKNTIGTEIKNTAYIYFDFNDPVITNTTLNTVSLEKKSLGVSNMNITGLNIYPNPVNSELTVHYLDGFSSLSILTLDGKKVKEFTLENKNTKQTIDVSDLVTGVYLLEVVSENNIFKTKIVKF